MAQLRVRIEDTFVMDLDDVFSRVILRVPRKQAVAALRHEVKYLVSEMCERVMDTPSFSEFYFACFLCREELADPRPGHEPPGWDRTLQDREYANAAA